MDQRVFVFHTSQQRDLQWQSTDRSLQEGCGIKIIKWLQKTEIVTATLHSRDLIFFQSALRHSSKLRSRFYHCILQMVCVSETLIIP